MMKQWTRFPYGHSHRIPGSSERATDSPPPTVQQSSKICSARNPSLQLPQAPSPRRWKPAATDPSVGHTFRIPKCSCWPSTFRSRTGPAAQFAHATCVQPHHAARRHQEQRADFRASHSRRHKEAPRQPHRRRRQQDTCRQLPGVCASSTTHLTKPLVPPRSVRRIRLVPRVRVECVLQPLVLLEAPDRVGASPVPRLGHNGAPCILPIARNRNRKVAPRRIIGHVYCNMQMPPLVVHGPFQLRGRGRKPLGIPTVFNGEHVAELERPLGGHTPERATRMIA